MLHRFNSTTDTISLDSSSLDDSSLDDSSSLDTSSLDSLLELNNNITSESSGSPVNPLLRGYGFQKIDPKSTISVNDSNTTETEIVDICSETENEIDTEETVTDYENTKSSSCLNLIPVVLVIGGAAIFLAEVFLFDKGQIVNSINDYFY